MMATNLKHILQRIDRFLALISMDAAKRLVSFLFWLCFIALNALALSPAPYLPPMEIFNWWDKAQHAIGFGTLAVLAALAYPHVSKLRLGVLLSLQGVAIELLQHWGGYRFGDWQDALADTVGVVLGLCLAHVLGKVAAVSKLLNKEADNNA
jgi:VanZ family protein